MDDRESVKLEQKAKLLKMSKLFLDSSDNGLLYKQNIFLVLAGKKPVTEAYSGHLQQASLDTQVSRPDDPKAVAALLDSLGLVYELLVDKAAVTATVALDQATLKRYNEVAERLMQSSAGSAQEAQDNTEIGQLYGFPKSAAEGFAQNEKLDAAEQERIVQAAGIPVYFAGFIFSATHYQEELGVVKEWYELIRRYGLV